MATFFKALKNAQRLPRGGGRYINAFLNISGKSCRLDGCLASAAGFPSSGDDAIAAMSVALGQIRGLSANNLREVCSNKGVVYIIYSAVCSIEDQLILKQLFLDRLKQLRIDATPCIYDFAPFHEVHS